MVSAAEQNISTKNVTLLSGSTLIILKRNTKGNRSLSTDWCYETLSQVLGSQLTCCGDTQSKATVTGLVQSTKCSPDGDGCGCHPQATDKCLLPQAPILDL